MTDDGSHNGKLFSHVIYLIWICDCSGSMAYAGKIQALNNAIREALPEIQRVAGENPDTEVLIRAVKFSDDAAWIEPAPVPVDRYTWHDLEADGVGDLGAALELVTADFRSLPMTENALPPVFVLLSDGQPTDSWKRGLEGLLDLPWGKNAVRVAISIGPDADNASLQEFVGHSEIPLLNAENSEWLVRYFPWGSQSDGKEVVGPRRKKYDSTNSPSTVEIPHARDGTSDSADDTW